MTALADLIPPRRAAVRRVGYKPSHAARVLRAHYAGREIVTSPTRGLPEGSARTEFA